MVCVKGEESLLKKIIAILILASVSIYLIGCTWHKSDNAIPKVTPQVGPTPQASPSPGVDTIKETIKNMTVNEKIGQMVITGLDGYDVNSNTRKMLTDYKTGGFIILGENVKSASQLLKLINSLKDLNSNNKIPLFIAVDGEGGNISRMPPEFHKIPLNRKVGDTGNTEFAYELGAVVADQLKSFGFNLDFAPVMDINSNPQNPVIGDRSFGSTPDIVTSMGIKNMEGIQSKNIIPVLKHFPGHGDTSVDSHIGLPLVTNGLSRLESFELIPFSEAIQNNADAVMTAHILLPNIDPENPATMSKVILTNILRDKLKFNGVIITDDMTMGAIVKNYNIGEAAVRSINAGSDLILVCHDNANRLAVIDALRKAARNGTIPMSRIDGSVYRILKLKEKYHLNDSNIKAIDVKKINGMIDSVLNKYLKQ